MLPQEGGGRQSPGDGFLRRRRLNPITATTKTTTTATTRSTANTWEVDMDVGEVDSEVLAVVESWLVVVELEVEL